MSTRRGVSSRFPNPDKLYPHGGDHLRTRFWVWLWWVARKRALVRLREDFSSEYTDAQNAWARGAVLTGDLDSPAWNTRGLAADLALHDAADGLMGEIA